MKTVATAGENRSLDGLGPNVTRGGAAIGLVALGVAAAVAANMGHAWETFFRAYLLGFSFITWISLGALFFVMVQHLTRAGWSVTIRRLAEGLAGNLRWLWIAFIPLWLGMKFSDTTHLYHWAITGATEHDPILAHKAAYLSPTFWTIRAAGYFLIWGLMARFFLRNSFEQDTTGDPQLTLRMQVVAAPCVGIWFFTQTFAAIDWIMALEPHWFSTMFGVYFFAGSMCAFAATMILLVWALQRSGRVTKSITTDHWQDMGKWLFSFGIVFWAYIAYSQFMLIWYANIPEETFWFLARIVGSWKGLSFFLLIGHFVAPFVLLLSRHPKRRPNTLAAAAAWMLFMYLVDLYWVIMPSVTVQQITERGDSYAALMREFADETLGVNPLQAACVIGMMALLLAGTAMGLRNRPLIPVKDPRLHEALAFENQ